jgi:AcrR family transcriptional regulator
MTPTSSALPRQTKRYEQKRQSILDAAVRLFNQKGLKGTTLADVAQSVGLITNSVTYYYRKKEELATACLAREHAGGPPADDSAPLLREACRERFRGPAAAHELQRHAILDQSAHGAGVQHL